MSMHVKNASMRWLTSKHMPLSSQCRCHSIVSYINRAQITMLHFTQPRWPARGQCASSQSSVLTRMPSLCTGRTSCLLLPWVLPFLPTLSFSFSRFSRTSNCMHRSLEIRPWWQCNDCASEWQLARLLLRSSQAHQAASLIACHMAQSAWSTMLPGQWHRWLHLCICGQSSSCSDSLHKQISKHMVCSWAEHICIAKIMACLPQEDWTDERSNPMSVCLVSTRSVNGEP